ncbi:hypothetical protein D9M71_676610 [compost metagenome]
MAGVAAITHGRTQVRRADKHPVNAFDRGNRIQVLQPFKALDLHQQAHLLIGLLQVTGDAVPARRPCQGTAHAAHALGRVVHGAYQLACLFSAFDHGYQQGLRADIQHLLDQRGVADHRADDRLGRVGGDGLQLAEHAAQVVGRMFAVDQQPVETGIGRQFCAVGIGQTQP